MNLWFRMLWLLLTFPLRPRLQAADAASVLDFRVLPFDVDFNIHLTNGRYQAIADIGRLDLALRTGLFRRVLRDGWAPIVSYSSVLYRRELRVWQKYQLTSQIVFWNDDVQIFEHVFRPASGRYAGQVAASILCVAAMYDRKNKAFVPAQQLLDVLGWTDDSPPPTQRVDDFIRSYQAFRATAKAESTANASGD